MRISGKTIFVANLLLAALSLSVIISKVSFAFSLGNFHRTCSAPNWLTGHSEAVSELNVYNQQSFPRMAFTKKLPFGRWRIEWNVPRIKSAQLPDLMIKFLYYHECAHARLNTPDEALADCTGLRAMQNDIGISQNQIKFIANYYKTRGDGRLFPPSGC